jgi:hypothetical protein
MVYYTVNLDKGMRVSFNMRVKSGPPANGIWYPSSKVNCNKKWDAKV